MNASIIIPTYNRKKLLGYTLNSLLNQDYNMNSVEIIICDDGSTDGTKEFIEEYKNKLNIQYYYQEDKGFRAGAARNIGIKNARSEICIFIDSGVILSSRAIKNHIKIHENNILNCAVIGYVYGFDNYTSNMKIIEENIDINDVNASIKKMRILDMVDIREKLYQELGDDINSWPAPWSIFWTVNVSVKTNLLREVGMFDERYNTWGGEDTDLAIALFEKKAKFILNRKCDAIEYPHKKENLYELNPEQAEKNFREKRNYMNEKYNLSSIKVWYEKRYDELNQELLKREKEKKSIIWNVTKYCSWNCKICCVNAKYVPNMVKINEECDENFKNKNELSLVEKKKIIDMLEPGKYRIDFSGGEIGIDPSNMELIEYAANRLGKDNIGISTSGAFLDEIIAERLVKSVKDVELTLDYIPYKKYDIRPIGYHEYAAHAIEMLKKYNINVGVQTVITKYNKSKKMIDEIYSWISQNGVDTWSILRFFNSGRGKNNEECALTYKEYKDIVEYIKSIAKTSARTKVEFQYLLPNHKKHTYECRAVKKSIGILPDGNVTGCFWALNEEMKVNNQKFLLGKLPESNINEILSSDKAEYWLCGQHSCKIFNKSEGGQNDK